MIRKIVQANAMLLIQYAVASLVPLLLIPRVVHVIGLTQFGQIAVLMAWASYGAAIVQYAFHLTGPKRAMQLEDGESTKDVLTNITAAKFVLLVIAMFLLAIGLMISPSLRPNQQIEWLLLLAAPFAAFLNSSWLLQSKDKFTTLAALGITGSVITLFVGFRYINFENEFVYAVAIFTSIFGMIFIGAGTLFVSFAILSKEASVFKISKVIDTIKDGWQLFVSQFLSLLYTGAGTLIINNLLGSESAGAYSVIEKITNAVMTAALLTHTAAYPRLAAAYTASRKSYLKILKLIILIYLTAVSFISLIVLSLQEDVIKYLYGEVNQERIMLLYLGLVWLVLGIFGTALTGYLTVAGKKNEIWPLTLKLLTSSMLLGIFGVQLLGPYGWLLGLTLSQSLVLMTGFKHWKSEYGTI